MIVKNTHIFDGNPIGKTSDIRISDEGLILQIAKNLDAADSETVIDCAGMIALPGLTDAHRHVWQAPFKSVAADMMLMEYLNRVVGGIGAQISAQELYLINLYGYIQCAQAGITNVFDWSHIMNSPEHADAAIQAAADSGLNVLFFHSTSAHERDKYWNHSTAPHDQDIERLAAIYKNCFANVRLGMGIRGPEFATMEVNKMDIQQAKALGIPASMHIGSSILGKIAKPVMQLGAQQLLSSDLNLVHCCTLSKDEFKLIGEAGCLVTMTPEAEMQTGLGEPAAGFIADIPGLKWSVGIDIPTSSTDSLMFQQRLLLQSYRAIVNNRIIEKMEFPVQMPYNTNQFFFDSMENANQFSGMNTSARIQVGAKACFSLIKWEDLRNDAFASNPAFYYLSESNIDSIVLNGKLAKSKGQWLLHDLDELRNKVNVIVARTMKGF
ncbi:amidohydrolase family protein [Dyadobacter alkalitolerans]|uniref:amidohydrolase family protein n=1 Tax=Dyadobacter alkalitolerans TaxID=492736 RepID=UPI00041B433D|nr:amidohydrolase family protein [Dyadobacter alkalitolerans]